MKRHPLQYFVVLVGALVTLSGCLGGGGTSVPKFVNGFRLTVLSEDVTFDGSVRRLAYVSNLTAGTITLVSLRNRRVQDTDEFDNEETPLTIGGNPTFVFEYRPAGLPATSAYRLVAIDRLNNRLFMFDATIVADGNSTTLRHDFVDLGGATITTASTPVFQDRGRVSTPVLANVTTNANNTMNENWVVESNGNGNWRVKGSISGEHSNRVTSGTPYTSDNGEISFTIFEGDRRSTNNDRFYFGTIKANPFVLPGTPESALLVGDKLYLGNRDTGSVDILDLPSLTLDASVALNDGTGEATIPTDIVNTGTNLVVTNSGSGQSVFFLNTSTFAVTPVLTGYRTTRALVNSASTEVFLFPSISLFLGVLDVASQTLLADQITANAVPIAGALLGGTEGVAGNALLTSFNSSVDLADLDARMRLDTEDDGDTESFVGRVFFVDIADDSNPSISDIITIDGVTRTETWTLTYEGTIQGALGSSGTTMGDLLVDAAATYTSLEISTGDRLVLWPNDPNLREEVDILSVDNDTTLRLSTDPVNQSGNIPYEVRAANSYTIFGSLSGFQTNRAVEAQSANSDNQEVTLSINSGTKATSRGDYFTFDTNDGLSPIFVDGDFPIDIDVFEDRAYILNQNGANISVIDIPRLRLIGDID